MSAEEIQKVRAQVLTRIIGWGMTVFYVGTFICVMVAVSARFGENPDYNINKAYDEVISYFFLTLYVELNIGENFDIHKISFCTIWLVECCSGIVVCVMLLLGSYNEKPKWMFPWICHTIWVLIARLLIAYLEVKREGRYDISAPYFFGSIIFCRFTVSCIMIHRRELRRREFRKRADSAAGMMYDAGSLAMEAQN